MLSALINPRHSHPAVPLARQLVHQRSVQPGPLVLGSAPFKFPAPAMDRDRTVSRRSEPSSRTALMGEQPNPWNLLQLQDAMSRQESRSSAGNRTISFVIFLIRSNCFKFQWQQLHLLHHLCHNPCFHS